MVLDIRDTGCGIPSAEAVDTLLAIGGSPKRGTDARGFRGVPSMPVWGFGF